MEIIFEETADFLRATTLAANIHQRRYDDFPRDLYAQELDFQNFIAEIAEVCSDYEHILE